MAAILTLILPAPFARASILEELERFARELEREEASLPKLTPPRQPPRQPINHPQRPVARQKEPAQEPLPEVPPAEAARPRKPAEAAPQDPPETLAEDAIDRVGVGADTVADRFKQSGYRCVDTPDNQGIFCQSTGRNYVTIPRGIDKVEKLVFYAHGLVGVCGNGASGERYLKYDSATLKRLNAIGIMPWRSSAGDTSFPLANFIARMDSIVDAKLPILLAGHSAAGPFFATELNGNGRAILGRVEKVLLLDAIYGNQAQRWNRILAANGNMKLHLLSTTTAGRANTLYANIENRFRPRVKKENFGGGHCEIPRQYFNRLAN